MTRRVLALLVVGLLAAAPGVARADAPLHLRSRSTVTTEGGSVLQLPPGYFLEEPAWNALDLELRRLQDTETRLTAENAKLRDLTKRRSVDTLWTIGISLGVGLLAGAVVVGVIAY